MARPKKHAATYQIATILPAREYFTTASAGAIALFVNETTHNSAYQDHITVYGRGDDQNQRRFRGVRYCPVEMRCKWLFGTNGAYVRGLIAEMRKRPVGLIEVHNRVALFERLAKEFPNTPITFYFHNDPFTIKGSETPKKRWAILERADAVYCCSDYIRRRFLTGLDAARQDHVHVLYHGVEPIQMPDKKSPIILYAGRLIKEKGALELAQAAQKVLPHHPKWQIAFVGANRPGGKNTTAYARQVNEAVASLGKQAVFMGPQPHAKVLEYFSRASIAVVPSIWVEPLGRTAIEAISAGCALVTSGHGGLAEIVGDAGILVSPITADGLALALQGMIEDTKALQAIQEKCAARRTQFSLPLIRQYFDQIRYQLMSQAYGG